VEQTLTKVKIKEIKKVLLIAPVDCKNGVLECQIYQYYVRLSLASKGAPIVKNKVDAGPLLHHLQGGTKNRSS